MEFAAFWDAYGLKRDRLAALRAWNRLSMKDRRDAIRGIAAYRADCQKRGISMMYGQGYLNHRRWEDEIEAGNGIANADITSSRIANASEQYGEMEEW